MGGGGRRRRASRLSATAAWAESLPPFDFKRASDATSLCSSRLSSVSASQSTIAAPVLITDRQSQAAALRSINAYLSSVSAPVHLKPPLPAARDITEAFHFLFSRLGYELSDLDEDLPAVFRALGCPLKLTRSALKNPGTPHAWPPLLSALNWLVQLLGVDDHLESLPAPDPSAEGFIPYITRSYALFISGADDEELSALDDEYFAKAEQEVVSSAALVESRTRELSELQAKVEALKTTPSRREILERQKEMLSADAIKFKTVVENFKGKLATVESTIREWESELEIKLTEARRITGENEELKKKIEGQALGTREVEKMRRLTKALEMDIADAENAVMSLDAEASVLDMEARHKFKEIEQLAQQCSVAAIRLNIENGSPYTLNADGRTPTEVMGIYYKTTLKSALKSIAESTRRNSVSRLQESTTLQEQAQANDKHFREKKTTFEALQTNAGEKEALCKLLKQEMENHALNFAKEVHDINEAFSNKEHQLSLIEKEAEELLKLSEAKLQEAIQKSDEETQARARDLLVVVNELSEYKEYVRNMTSKLKNELAQAIKDVAESLKAGILEDLSPSGLRLFHRLESILWSSQNSGSDKNVDVMDNL